MDRIKYIRKLGYKATKRKNFLEVVVGDIASYIDLTMKLRAHTIETQEFWSFRGQREESWSLGLEYKFIDKKEVDVDQSIEQFKKRCKEFNKPEYISDNEKWNWLFFAQHHGLHTHLLDWTSNPLVALYFAVENINSSGKDQRVVRKNKKKKKKLGNFGAVWMLKVNNIHYVSSSDIACTKKEPDSIKQWSMIDPPPITHRISRQSGKFTFHPPSDSKDISECPRRPDEEELIKIVLKKYKKTKKSKRNMVNPSSEIRAHLGIMNIHHGYLFPDHQGVATFVNNEWPIISPKYSELH